MFACCFSLVGCDAEPEGSEGNIPTESTEPASVEEADVVLPTYYSAEYAEGVYNDAIANSLTQTKRKNIMENYDFNGLEYEKVGPKNSYVINNVYCVGDNKWYKDGKLYNEESKTYIVVTEDVNFDIDFLIYILKEFDGADITCATIYNGVTTIYINEGTTSRVNASIVIENNLITKINLVSYTNGDVSQIITANFAYDNLSFPRSIPTDFDTYTLAE